MQVLCSMFVLFEGASGLGCNVNNCHMTPIRCSEDPISLATNIFPCQLVDFPVTYLSMPLSVCKLPRTTFQPLIDRMTDRLPMWKGRLLHRSGWLVLIKTTLMAVLIHVTISVELPPWVLKAMHKIMIVFLWSRADEVHGEKCLVGWNQV
jgi:hypothetical protein